MKTKKLYIIPGWKEATKRKPYQELKRLAEEKGYEVILKNIDWKKNLGEQTFSVEKDSTLFGFSLGAVLARLVAQESECKKLILASMTPLKYFTNKKFIPDLVEVCGKDFVYNIKDLLKKNHLAKKEITMSGSLEGSDADIVVKGIDHELNEVYLKEIIKLL